MFKDFDFTLSIPPENQMTAITSLLLTNLAVSHAILMQISELASHVDTTIDSAKFLDKYETLIQTGFEEQKALVLSRYGE